MKNYQTIFQRITTGLLCVCLMLALTSQYVSAEDSAKQDITTPDGSVVLENDVIRLVFDQKAKAFTVSDCKTGVIWNSVADNSNDEIARGKERTNLASVLQLTYYDTEKGLMSTSNTAVCTNVKTEVRSDSLIVYFVFSDLQIMIPISLKVHSDGFSCTILTSQIVEKSNYRVFSLNLLPHFGATNQKDGYLFLPDGSGALVNFQDGKADYATYRAQVYGRDECLDVLMDSDKSQPVRLPVFGLNRVDSGFFGIITQGDADAYITASVRGQTSSFSRVSAEFTVRTKDSYAMGESNGGRQLQTVNVYEEKALSKKEDASLKYEAKNFSVRYFLLKKEACSYSDMAQIYRAYLLKQTNLKEKNFKPEIQIELPCAAQVSNKIFGISFNSTKPLNTTDDIRTLLDTLIERGVESIDLRLTNWSSQQLKSQISDNSLVISAIGGNGKMNKLIKRFSNNNVRFYFNTDFYEARTVQLGYLFKKMPVYNVSRKSAIKYGYELENYLRSPNIEPKTLIAPSKMKSLSEKYIKALKIQGAYIGVDKMTSSLSSDFRERGWIRSDSKKAVMKALGVLNDSAPLMSNGGNAYALGFSKTIINAPECASNFDIEDVSVPFYQLVVSGLVSYSYQPINSNTDAKKLFLKSVETGAVLHFYLVSRNHEYFPDTAEYSKFTSIDANEWIDDIAVYYAQMEVVYKATDGSKMIAHHILDNNVFETVFANGCRIITNYGKSSWSDNDVSVDALDYQIVTKGDR